MSVNGLNTAYSGMMVNQFRQDVTANNIANVNTDGFRASEVATTDSAYINDIGTGTRVAATYQPNRPGPMAVDATGGTATDGTATPAAVNGVAATGMVELSNTDIVRDMTNQMAAQQAYGANANMVRSVDEMTQTILNLRS